VEPWRPEPLLCRRFNVPDPYKGRPAAAAGASRFQTDHLALPDTAAALAAAGGRPALPGPGTDGAPGSGGGGAAGPPAPAAGGAAAPAAPAAQDAGEVLDAGALADAFLGSLGQEVSAFLFYHHPSFEGNEARVEGQASFRH